MVLALAEKIDAIRRFYAQSKLDGFSGYPTINEK